MDIRDEIAMANLAKQQLIPPTTEQATPTKAFEPNLPSPEKLTKSAELNKELKAIEDLVVADSVEQPPNDKDDIEKISKKPLTPLKRLKLKKKTLPSKHQQTFEIKYRKEPNEDPKESKKLESEVEVTENDDGSMLLKGTRRSWRIALNTSFSKYTNDIRNPDKIDSDDDDQASKGKTVKGEVQKKRAPKIVMEERKSETEPVSEFENEAKPYVPYNGDRIPCRTKIKHFIEMVEGLNEKQKSEIRRIGFGSVLSFNIKHVPTGLGQWLVNNYDENNNTLNIGSCKLNVTPLEVSQILGIPMGEELVSKKERPRGTTDEVLAEFKGQFPDHIAKRIYLTNVLGIMTSQQDSGWVFVLNFLVVFNTVFGLTLRNSTVNKRFLSCITADVDVKKFNWCEYVIRNLKREMREWDRTNAFCGPLVILAV
ncbi:hypothetical protein SSX86_016613 [Deinandra increscens subsp. villosa]|uniref:Uncharacterized protein n=1 Tax=Deinandra increscens subsp. villosa TaxID=3103831 RepID=A0AAP0CYD2_9ASTR